MKNKFQEYEQAYLDYCEDDNKYCSLPLPFGLVEIFMFESSCELGISYSVFVDKREFDGGIYKDDLFQDEIGDFEFDMCIVDVLRDLSNRHKSLLIINTQQELFNEVSNV